LYVTPLPYIIIKEVNLVLLFLTRSWGFVYEMDSFCGASLF
jgi:hypothetical protein